MAGRDDFGSGSKSPGGWGGTGGGGMGGGMGGNKSSSNYNYRSGAGQRGPAIGNWNTGGRIVGTGNQFGVNDLGENNMGRGPWPGGYAAPVMRRPVPSLLGSLPQPNAYPPPVTQEDIPGVVQPEPAPQGIPWAPQRYVNPGYGMDPNGIGRTVTPRTAPQGYFGAANPSYTPAGAGGPSSYRNMGNDFRSASLGNGPWSPR